MMSQSTIALSTNYCVTRLVVEYLANPLNFKNIFINLTHIFIRKTSRTKYFVTGLYFDCKMSPVWKVNNGYQIFIF